MFSITGMRKVLLTTHHALGSRWLRTLPRLEPSKEAAMSRAIGSWDFSAHDYSEDELVHVAFLMLQHALAMPELDNWRLPAGMIP